MKYCKNCGAQLREEDKFCTKCGTPAELTPHSDAPKEGGRLAGMYNDMDGDKDGGAKGVDFAKKKPKTVKPWFIVGAIVLIVIILVLVINLGSCGADTPDTSSAEQTTAQTEPEKPAVVEEEQLYLADMIDKSLGFINDYYAADYDKLDYEDEVDLGPSLYCSNNGDYDNLAIFATAESHADKNAECVLIYASGSDKKVFKNLPIQLTYSELQKIVGSLSKPSIDPIDGYYVTFEKDGYRISYCWGFDEYDDDYGFDPDYDWELLARDPQKEKAEGVYISKSDGNDSEAALKEFAVEQAYYGWVDETATMDEYLKDTMGVIYTIGEEKVPVLILRCDSALHYQGYTRAYKYVNGEVIEISIADNVAYLNLDTGLMETTYTGGGYGETESNYYHVDNDPNNAGPLSSSSEFREYDDEMGIGNHYWLGAMYDEGEMSKNEISKEEFDKLMKPYRKGSNVIDDFYGKMESQMETIAHWK